MALIPLNPAPPRHFRPQTLASEPAALTPDPYLLDTSDNTAAENRRDPAICGFGSCALSPECTRRCRYRQAHQDLGHYAEAERSHARLRAIEQLLKEPIPDREPMPKVDHKLRRTVWIGITAYALWLVALAAWYFTS
jgi:hypothetical protein